MLVEKVWCRRLTNLGCTIFRTFPKQIYQVDQVKQRHPNVDPGNQSLQLDISQKSLLVTRPFGYDQMQCVGACKACSTKAGCLHLTAFATRRFAVMFALEFGFSSCPVHVQYLCLSRRFSAQRKTISFGETVPLGLDVMTITCIDPKYPSFSNPSEDCTKSTNRAQNPQTVGWTPVISKFVFFVLFTS